MTSSGQQPILAAFPPPTASYRITSSDMDPDRRAAKAVSQLREMEVIHGSFPFGIEVSQRILSRSTSLLALITSAGDTISGRPSDQHIYSRLGDASAAYTELGGMEPISWIEHHELVRSRFVQLLSPSKKKKNTMNDADRLDHRPVRLREWRYGVVLFAKSLSKKLKSKRNKHDEFQKKAQICIDAIHSLITILRDNSEEALFQDDYGFLVALCQRAILLPGSFSCSNPEGLTIEGAPADAGASANVYRGSLGTAPMAVKNFRLYYRTVNQVKKRFIREVLILQLVQHPNVLRFISILNESLKIRYLSVLDGASRRWSPLFISIWDRTRRSKRAKGNILVDDHGKAAVADFGLSFIQREDLIEASSHTAGRLSPSVTSISTLAATVLSAGSSTGGGTFRWMAPERLVPSAYNLPTAKATMKSDVYSFGMLVLEVYSRTPPWGSRAEGGIALSVVTNLRPARPEIKRSVNRVEAGAGKSHQKYIFYGVQPNAWMKQAGRAVRECRNGTRGPGSLPRQTAPSEIEHG
ncbi:kinase-like domain-containing protein [Mycena latifolia]|nr:kinase-like domain-containing protein [Mycena latifolia]